jgi:hypothetical protein
MKPDWKDAPDWAKYTAMDKNGAWFWYEFKPVQNISGWTKINGKIENACINNWQKTFKERPRETKE